MTQDTTYQYDGVGNLVEKIDAKGQKTEYKYDDAGRLEEVRYFDPGDPDNPVKVVNFTYDKVGNLKTYDDGVTTAAYDYDDLHRKITETVDYGIFELSTSYTYYKNGTKKTIAGPDGIVYEYTYDLNNQFGKLVNWRKLGTSLNTKITWHQAFLEVCWVHAQNSSVDRRLKNEMIKDKQIKKNVETLKLELGKGQE